MDKIIIVSIAISILCVLIDSLLSFPLQQKIPPFYIAVLAAFSIMLINKNTDSANNRHCKLSRTTCVAFVLISSVLFVITVYMHTNNIQASRHDHDARIYQKQKSWQKMYNAANRSTQLNPYDETHFYHLGVAALFLNQYEDAIAALKKSLKLVPYKIMTQKVLAKSFEETGEYHTALNIYKNLISMKPDYLEPYIRTARIYLALGDSKNALSAFQAVAEKWPEYGATYYNMGVLHSNRGDARSAAASFEQAIQNSYKVEASHGNLAYLYYYNLGNKDAAHYHMEKYLQISPNGALAEEFNNMIHNQDAASQ